MKNRVQRGLHRRDTHYFFLALPLFLAFLPVFFFLFHDLYSFSDSRDVLQRRSRAPLTIDGTLVE